MLNDLSRLFPPGVLVDVTQNYGAAFYSCAAGMGLSALFLGLVKPAKKGVFCRRGRAKHSVDLPERDAKCKEESGEQKSEHRTNHVKKTAESEDQMENS